MDKGNLALVHLTAQKAYRSTHQATFTLSVKREAVLDDSRIGGRDLFLRKYDSAGTILWARQFGTRVDERNPDVAVDNLEMSTWYVIHLEVLKGQTPTQVGAISHEVRCTGKPPVDQSPH